MGTSWQTWKNPEAWGTRTCLEGLPQVHVDRLFVIVVEPVAEVQRPQWRIKTQEDADGVDVAAVELVVVVPRPAALQRAAGVQREVQRQVGTRGQASIIDRSGQADVLAGD